MKKKRTQMHCTFKPIDTAVIATKRIESQSVHKCILSQEEEKY